MWSRVHGGEMLNCGYMTLVGGSCHLCVCLCVSIWYDPLFNSSSTAAHMDRTHTHVHTCVREQLKEAAHRLYPSILLLEFSPPPCGASGLIQVSTFCSRSSPLRFPLCFMLLIMLSKADILSISEFTKSRPHALCSRSCCSLVSDSSGERSCVRSWGYSYRLCSCTKLYDPDQLSVLSASYYLIL